MRGTWYYDGSWIPLETEHSKVIEEAHLKLFHKEDKDQSSSKSDANPPQSYKGERSLPNLILSSKLIPNWNILKYFVTLRSRDTFSVLRTEQFPEFHVDWHSISDVTLYSEYTPTKLMRSVTSKLGFAKSEYAKVQKRNKNDETLYAFTSCVIRGDIVFFSFKLLNSNGLSIKKELQNARECGG